MAVEFLTDEQAARYGSFHEAPSRAELERYFFLDDADREAVQAKRRTEPFRLLCRSVVSHQRGWDTCPRRLTPGFVA
ncbi:DUF4158 domain-containing protein, partial [Streptomyces sioyaensis]|uniref:DUF4158 domain-containing protein n=1 Tax=Streptomyces sioyaensis TaxID=67364 RepID=UPI003411A49D